MQKPLKPYNLSNNPNKIESLKTSRVFGNPNGEIRYENNAGGQGGYRTRCMTCRGGCIYSLWHCAAIVRLPLYEV